MVLTSSVTPAEAGLAIAAQWNVFLFFAGMMLIAAVADGAGFFSWAGAVAAALSRGSARLLMVNVFVVGALTSTFLSNDATAIILTPIVYAVVRRLRLPALPYLFATTFVADTASMTLPVSNPINILVVQRIRPTLGEYEFHLLPASLLVILVNLGIFLFVFRRQVQGNFHFDWRSPLDDRASHPPFFRAVCVALAMIAGLYVFASFNRWPLGPVALSGGLALLLIAACYRRLDLTSINGHIRWPLFGFVGGLFVLVQGVEHSGLTAALVSGAAHLVHGPAGAALVGLASSAMGSNLVNNFPATLILISGLSGAHLPAGSVHPFMFGALAGADLGPNLTPLGSLSTMLWLLIVRRHGIEISGIDYLRLGLLVTPAMLVVAGLALALTFGW